MNARFQREIATSGSDPSLCVKCHAPLALAANATTDGTNMATVEPKLHGVTCFFCHTVSAVADTHNQGLTLATDNVLRGPIADPAHGASHTSTYSALHDLNDPTSSSLCGSCHDLVNGHGTTVEKTFIEWQASLYSQNIPAVSQTCGSCHMLGSVGPAATTAGAPMRRVHDHSLASFDVALSSFPQSDAQRVLVQQTLDASIIAKLCVNQPTGGPDVSVTLDNAFVGHEFPSGAAHDRRVWVELIAYDDTDAQIYSSGVVPDGTSVTDITDPALWLLRDQLVDGSNQPVSFLWQAFGANASTLPPAVTNVPTDPKFIHSVTRMYTAPLNVARVAMRVRAVPIGLDVLGALVTSGDLDPAIVTAMPTFDLTGTKVEWSLAKNGFGGCVP